MKNSTKFLNLTIVAMLLFGFCFLFSGCSTTHDEPDNSLAIEGTYKFASVSFFEEIEGTDFSATFEAGDTYMDELLTEDSMVLTLNKDGSAVVVVSSVSDGTEEKMTQVGSWVSGADNTVVITFDGSSVSCTCDGKTLIIEEQEMSMTFKK